MSKSLEILKNSLLKKEAEFDKKLQNHFDTVKLANGQPLNDKKNGFATISLWDRQNESLSNLQKSIDKTKKAIEKEETKISNVEDFEVPQEIKNLIKNGVIKQWRKHPRFFFVDGVDRARFSLSENGLVSHKYFHEIVCKEQREKFVIVYNDILRKLREKKEKQNGN